MISIRHKFFCVGDMAKAQQWKISCWIFHPDRRKTDLRPRHRHRQDKPCLGRTRKACPTCVEQGLARPRLARRGWCEGHCKNHAKEKGLKKPEGTNKACADEAKTSKATKQKPQKKCKKSAQLNNSRVLSSFSPSSPSSSSSVHITQRW